MAAPHSPIGSRRRLGAELRRLRNRPGLTLDDVAEQMTCSTVKISRLETGKGIPKVPDVRELMRIYGSDAAAEQQELLQLVHDGREHGWWESLHRRRAARALRDGRSRRYAALESEATSVAAFEIAVLHGLLQTAGLHAGGTRRDPADRTRTTRSTGWSQLRGSRQQALHRRDPPVELTVVLDESVLRRQVGGSAVMVGQLHRLLDLSRRPNVVIQVLPFEAGVHRAHRGTFRGAGHSPRCSARTWSTSRDTPATPTSSASPMWICIGSCSPTRSAGRSTPKQPATSFVAASPCTAPRKVRKR